MLKLIDVVWSILTEKLKFGGAELLTQILANIIPEISLRERNYVKNRE